MSRQVDIHLGGQLVESFTDEGVGESEEDQALPTSAEDLPDTGE